ncbi:hypothetical protein ACHAWT_002337 [Skeletonema menzelii]
MTAASNTSSPTPKDNRHALCHGLGLFGESYLLFSIGTLRPLWETLYPLCFSNNNNNDNGANTSCPHPYLTYNSLSYSVVLGVMLGMLIVGNLAGRIGRRNGSLLTASIMVGGAVILVLASWLLAGKYDNSNENDNSNNNKESGRPDVLFMVMSAALFLFGIGVGGEYPLSASLASERAMVAMKERRRLEEEKEEQNERRGKMIATDLISSRLLTTTALNDDCSSNHEVKGNNLHSWQTTTTTSANMTTQIEHYNVAQQSKLSTSKTSSSSKTLSRGREVIVVFSMQGMGILANSLILTFLLLLTKQKGQQQQNDNDDINRQNDDYNDNNNSYTNQYHNQITLLYIWRIIYAIGLAILIYVLVSRIRHLNESEVWTQDRLKRDEEGLERRQQQSMKQQQQGGQLLEEGDSVGFVPPSIVPQDVEKEKEENENEQQQQCREQQQESERQLLFKHYGIRLFGTSITWLLWDIAFYGNKLFQSTFLLALTGEDATLTHISGAAAINAFVALLGYYAAALIVDNPNVGRLRLQQTGFVITGTLFLICGFLSEHLSSTTLVVIYLGSSFFGQCGPNCTTFLIPAEVFPTELRTVCHGISASAGKLGALIASILFTFAKTDKALFLISGYTSFAAAIFTFLTIPDLTTLDLYEIDRHWRMILNGTEYEYDGLAVDPKHLSYLERRKNRSAVM